MNSLIGRFLNVWLHPWASMASIKEQGMDAEIKSSMIFIVVMGLVSGVITAVVGSILPPPAPAGAALPKWIVWLAVVLVPLISFIGSFVGAFILWGLIDGFLKGSLPEYKTAYRLLALLAAFSPVSALLSAVPKVGQYLAIAVNLWAMIVMIRGIIIVRETKPGRTWTICGILFGLLFLLGIAMRAATNRGAFPGGPDFSGLDGGLGQKSDLGDLDLGDEELDKELKDLAEKAKAEEKAKPEEPKK